MTNRPGDHQAWLEDPYRLAGEDPDLDERDGECNVNMFGLNIDFTVEGGQISDYSIQGIEDREEALDAAERAADQLRRPFDALTFTDGQIIDLIHDAFVPGSVDMDVVFEAVKDSGEQW